MTDTKDNIFVLNRALGKDQNGCQHCMRRNLCPVSEAAGTQLYQGANGGISQKNVRQGQHVFNAGEDFHGIYMIKSGFFKSYFMDSDGEIQVTGFYFPGEVFGMDGIESGQYSHSVEALDTGSICRIPCDLLLTATSHGTPADNMKRSAGQQNHLLQALVRIMSKAGTRDRHLIFALGKMNARRRFATFLLDIAERMAHSGFSKAEIHLCMGRIDIANYLCLAMETVSRMFTLFQSMGILTVNRRDLVITDMGALQAIVAGEAETLLMLDKAS
ncbi:MAG: helix-turn-helix domain-containing protein [Pseudomonadales bacterium]|nr:helix-turn-helix domain-containing protein [Pseudomonadales bacterium]